MIIDSHVHAGSCDVFGLDQPPAQVMQVMERHHIAASLVQPFPGAWDAAAVHDAIATMAAEHPGRVFGIASVPPHGNPDAYSAEIRRCVRELHFVGVKLHTIGHAVGPASPGATVVAVLGEELDVPVLIHTGLGIPFSDPAVWQPLIQRHPTVRFVLCHAGGGILGGAAAAVARTCDNVWLETSAVGVQDLHGFRRTLGADRLMYGSDLLTAVPVELAKYDTLDLTEVERARVMHGTAEEVFRLQGQVATP